MLVHGVKGGLGPKLQGSHGTGQHPQHCQHHPQDADDAGEWGDHTIGGGGGGTWPRDWYIYMTSMCFLRTNHAEMADCLQCSILFSLVSLNCSLTCYSGAGWLAWLGGFLCSFDLILTLQRPFTSHSTFITKASFS